LLAPTFDTSVRRALGCADIPIHVEAASGKKGRSSCWSVSNFCF
jgi:hypothetical protein